MYVLHKQDTIVLSKELSLPSSGIICAHPGRVKRIAEEFLENSILHTDYRGFQVYVGRYQSRQVFVANTGIGASAAAFLLEELIAFGARTIIRLGSDDSKFEDYTLKLVEETSIPMGLALDYAVFPNFQPKLNPKMFNRVIARFHELEFPLKTSVNLHIEGYYMKNFNPSCLKSFKHYSSADMESGALYLLGEFHQLDFATILLSYPKHEGMAEYGDQGRSLRLENQGIALALSSL